MARNKTPKEKKTPFWKKKWFWIAFIVLGLIGWLGSGTEEPSTTSETETPAAESIEEAAVVYTITGGETGEYGKIVTLNKDTDMPVEKYLYKLPAGTYKVTTTDEKMASFFIVKDEIIIDEDNVDYPENLDYVSTDGYLMTAGDDDFNGKAKKEVVVTIAEDESISIPPDGDTSQVFNFEAQ